MREIRLVPVALGMVLLVAFLQAGEYMQFQPTAGIALDFISPLEYRFWLSHATMAIPGVLLVAWGLAPLLAHRLAAVWAWGKTMPRRSWLLTACGYFAFLVLVATVGRQAFLLGLPITDDERAVDFGAQIIASGKLSVPVLQPEGAYVQKYTMVHEGMVFSMEFPGALFARALSLVTGLGSLLYALLAASTGCVVAAAAGTIAGRRGAMVAALVWLCSPMARLLSMTGHNHIVSQLFVALVIWMYLRITVKEDRSWKAAAVLGFAGALAFLTRSAEAAFVLTPMVLHLLVLSWRDPTLRLRTGLAALIALAGLALYAWYNVQTTGSIVPARFGSNVEGATALDSFDFTARFGGHLAHNWMVFLVMALGPAGALLIVFLAGSRSTWIAVLSASAAALLSLSLFHNNIGIHEVGPIHLSDLVHISAIFASIGILRFADWVGKTGLKPAEVGVGLACYFVVGLGLFTVFQGMGMRRQAEVQATALDVVSAVVERPAIVVAPSAAGVRQVDRDLAQAGSWVYEYPHPDPYLEAPVIFVKEGSNLDELFARFPDRHFYSLSYVQDVLPVKVTRIR